MAKFCNKCGAILQPGASFCKQCGSRVGEAEQLYQQPQGNPFPPATQINKADNSSKNIIAVVVAVVAVIAIGAITFWALKSEDKPVANTQQQVTTQQPASASQQKEKLNKLVKDKDALDLEIKELANGVNDYLKYNSNFMGSSANNIKYRAKTTLEHVQAVQNEAKLADLGDQNIKGALLEVLDAEAGRANGLYKGIMDSATNGDYSVGFGEGTKAAYRFDEANARLNSLMGK